MPETNGDLWDSEKRLMIYFIIKHSCECRNTRYECTRCDLLDKTRKAWPSLYAEVLDIIRKNEMGIAP